ncbi:MAG: DUF2905 domain-containing protein [Deltaproteobacteria bacterium]|nr:DUF2905 domain-containing protein [Candidatus Anaeroferrophillus wilburensis]MBN2888577.1 DUF2905 domain-containing protein [Deltaproteobacteria bacterium]
MHGLGKLLLAAGLCMAVLGLVLVFAGQIPFLGRLPGDILIKKDETTFFFPLTTCIIVSILVSLVFYLFRR